VLAGDRSGPLPAVLGVDDSLSSSFSRDSCPKARAHNLCGRAPLVLAPHTIMCMIVESFAEENRSPLHV